MKLSTVQFRDSNVLSSWERHERVAKRPSRPSLWHNSHSRHPPSMDFLLHLRLTTTLS